MTTRRHILAGLGAAGLLTACRVPAVRRPAKRAAVPDLLLVNTTSGTVTLYGERMYTHGVAVSAPDGRRVYVTQPMDGGDTFLSAVESSTGQETHRVRLAGRWVPRVVSPSGRLVALTPPDVGSVDAARTVAGPPAARVRSRIMIAGVTGVTHDVQLTGNFEPDAVTYDDAGVFVL